MCFKADYVKIVNYFYIFNRVMQENREKKQKTKENALMLSANDNRLGSMHSISFTRISNGNRVSAFPSNINAFLTENFHIDLLWCECYMS